MKGLAAFRALSALSLVFAAVAISAAQTQLVFWNFNEPNPLDDNATLAADGGVFAAQAQLAIALAEFRFNSNTGSRGSPADPKTKITPNTPNLGASDHPVPCAKNSGQAGIVVSVPTTGCKDIVIKFDVRWSNTSSKYRAVEYTTDGGINWNQVRVLEAKRGDRWHSEPNSNGYGEPGLGQRRR